MWAPPSSCSIPKPTLDLGTRPTKDKRMHKKLFISQLLNIPLRLFRVGGALSARTLSSHILVKDAESLELPQENVTVFVRQFFVWRCGILLIWDLSL